MRLPRPGGGRALSLAAVPPSPAPCPQDAGGLPGASNPPPSRMELATEGTVMEKHQS